MQLSPFVSAVIFSLLFFGGLYVYFVDPSLIPSN
jgi:hypothetical protein